MYTIVKSLVKKLSEYKADFHYGIEIVDYHSEVNKLTGLIDQYGKAWNADVYIINADAAVFRGEVFNRRKFRPKKLDKMNWTMGYLTFYIGVNTKLPQVEHHNYFLGNNYESYAKDVMKNPGTLEKPYYYVNVLSRHNDDCAPEGHEALFFVCPVPNLLYKQDWSDKDKIIQSILDDFSERIHQDISKNIVLREAYTPLDWEKQFNMYRGAGLGLSHKMMQIGALRPKNYDERFKNAFYVGGSTIPGAGLPMTVISSKLTVERVLNFEK
jgi:phytoene desaturase